MSHCTTPPVARAWFVTASSEPATIAMALFIFGLVCSICRPDTLCEKQTRELLCGSTLGVRTAGGSS